MTKRKPKVLFFDIETSPNVVLSWRIGYKINITAANILEERRIICISYKWQGAKKVKRLTWDSNQCDKQMLATFVEVLRESDVAVGHNGDKFDLKWVKTRALLHGLPPLNNVITIDTLKLARANFNFNCNRLDYLGEVLGVGRKLETGGYDLWLQVMGGSRKALKTMGKYCDQDVILLEDVFNALVPHVKSLTVHMGLLSGNSKLSCESCGSDRMGANGSYIKKNGVKMKVITCKACGSSRSMAYQLYKKLTDLGVRK